MSDDLVKRMNAARDFPNNTCPSSRHAAMVAEALLKGGRYPMLEEEPEHCGQSIAATVAALWECRAENSRLREALDALPDNIDIYRAIKRSGSRKHGEIAKVIANMLPNAALQETDK